MNGEGRLALVTGASSGIGRACVERLSGAGWQVVAAARRRDRLAALAARTGCRPLPLDVTDREAVYTSLAPLEVDLLVNNAGLGRAMGEFDAASPADIDRTITTNVAAALHVARAVLPAMRSRRSGHIVTMGSITGLHALPSVIYSASKGAMHLMNQALRLEFAGCGIRFTEICPGRVLTEFFDIAHDDPADATARTQGLRALDPDDIAEAVLYAVGAPAHVNVSTIEITPLDQVPGGLDITPLAAPAPGRRRIR